jgi:Na+/melibiose symporter-like transporter
MDGNRRHLARTAGRYSNRGSISAAIAFRHRIKHPRHKLQCVQAVRNFRVLLMHGTLFKVGIQLSSVLIVIPYVADQVGNPGLVVALLVPAFTAGTLLGMAFAPRVFRISVSVAGLLGGIALADAALTALIAVDIAVVPTRFVAYPMLLLCILIGIVVGSLEVASPMAMSALLSAEQRSDLLVKQSGYGAALVIGITAVLASRFVRDVLPWNDVDLLWIGAAAMALCAACCLGLRTRGVELASGPGRMLDTLRDGHTYLRTNRWMQRFLATQLVFMSVTLSPMFYAIYAAESLGAGSGDMDDFLVFFGLGLLAGIPLWRLVRTRLGVRGMYACSAGISVVAATVCIVSQRSHVLPGLWALGPVLLLSALANQAVWPAAYDWVFSNASDEQAVAVISYSQIVVSLGVIFAGFAFSVAAEYGPDVWPLVLLLALTALACLAAARVPHTVANV